MTGERPMPPWFRPMGARLQAEAPSPYMPPVLVEAEEPEVAA